MSGTEMALVITAAFSGVAALITAVTGLVVGVRNTRKIQEVHELTNSLATRSEANARREGEAVGNIKGRQDLAAEGVTNDPRRPSK